MDPISLPICLRAYAVPHASKELPPKAERPGLDQPSRWTLVFDTETTIDAAQRLRIITYGVWDDDLLHERGIAYPPDMPEDDRAVLERYAAERGVRLIDRATFILQVFYRYGYDRRGTIVGFNLPFDISRIAISHGDAKRDWYGGFTFYLTQDRRLPPVQVRHLSRRAALIRFGTTFGQRTPRNMRRRGERMPIRRGFFVDVKTIAAALFSRSFSLESLSTFLKVAHPKTKSDEHGAALTPEYLDYALKDVLTTWECFTELKRRYAELDLPTPLHRIYSEASIGKANLRVMGVKPWREVQQAGVPARLVAIVLSTYFGGRAEVRIRRMLRQVVLCDFLSMYPTVNTLMGLWWFMVAQGIRWRDATAETREILMDVKLEDLQQPAFWRHLTVLVRIKPDADVLPIRAQYVEGASETIALNHLSFGEGLWLTLADCIASKLHTGRAPEVLEAIRFEPGPPQEGLKPILIAGNPAYRVNPAKQDFYKVLIELRQTIKDAMAKAPTKEEWDRLDAIQLALKIAANATSYGISVEMNVKEHARKVPVTVHPGDGEPFEVMTKNVEEPGPYFHPLLGTLITGAARLMLSLAERLVADKGLEWAFCDTDSMAIAKPEAMDNATFLTRVDEITDWFSALNPYAFGGSILKVEDVNFGLHGPAQHEPLFVWAVSAKRYALFNVDGQGQPVIRKASAHGLGQLQAPYDTESPASGTPVPAIDLRKAQLKLWQHDLWWSIVKAALDGEPDRVDLGYHPALQKPAVSRYAATSPKLLKWFDRYNAGRSYDDQLRPFGFLSPLYANPFLCEREVIRPVAPYADSPELVAANAFDRVSGERVAPEILETYATQLAQYHLKPEDKFDNGDFLARGITRRRQVHATNVEWVGKEANRWEEQAHLGMDEDAQITYGSGGDAFEGLAADLRVLAKTLGERRLAGDLRCSRQLVKSMVAGAPVRLPETRRRAFAHTVVQLMGECGSEEAAQERARSEILALIGQLGLRGASLSLATDPSNLLKMARGTRAISKRVVERLSSHWTRAE
jgi:hypothetical protein